MKQKVYSGSWVGCSDYSERVKRMKAEKWTPQQLKEALDEKGFKVRRARIARKPKRVVVRLNGFNLERTMSYEEYLANKSFLTIVMNFY